jgi:transcriptional regulator with XRE-family HTH domain
MKDFELTLRIRNNRLKRRRRELGLTPPKLAERAGISYSVYMSYEGLKVSPLKKAGTAKRDGTVAPWKKSALALAAFYCCLPEDLWPTAILAIRKPEIVAEIEGAKILAASSPEAFPQLEDVVFERERSAAVNAVLARLPPRRALALRKEFGFEGFDGELERADGRGVVTSERVSQLKSAAIQSMMMYGRFSGLAAKLRPFYDESES